MRKIPLSNIKRHKPLIVNTLAKEAWGDSEKGLLSRKLLRDSINSAIIFLAEKLPGMSREQLTALLVDYLRVIGYSINNWDFSEEHPYITTYLIRPDSTKSIGLAIADRELSFGEISSVIEKNPKAEYYHLMSLSGIQDKFGDKFSVITTRNMTQLLVFIAVSDYFYNTYMYSILNMPGFKEYLNRYIRNKLGLTPKLVEKFETGWADLR